MRESFIFYRSFYDAIKDLPDAERLKMYDAITDFALNENEQNLEGILKQFFILIKPQILANNNKIDKYNNDCENGKKGAEYGKLGGRPKKNTPPKNPPLKTPPQNPPKNPINVNVNDNANVNDNSNANVNDNENDNENIKGVFDLFFNSYPKQEDEEKTYRMFLSVINEKEALPEELIEGANRYRKYTAGSDPKFIKAPFNWLRDMSWKNDYEIKDTGNETPYNAFAL